MVKKILYGTSKIRDISFDGCNGLCTPIEKHKCGKDKRCNMQLCGDEERTIGKVGMFEAYQYGDKIYNKIEKAVETWRKMTYKRCKPIKFTIQRP